MSDVSSSEEAFFLVCKYLLTMNPPESILNPIQIVKGVPGFIVTLYQIAVQNRPDRHEVREPVRPQHGGQPDHHSKAEGARLRVLL